MHRNRILIFKIFIYDYCFQMKSKKKYTIKKSELKEIIKEMILMEAFNPDDYKMHTTRYDPSQKMTGGDVVSKLVKGAKALPSAIISAFPGSEKLKDKAAQNPNGLLQWLLGAAGATKDGTAGPDYVPNWWDPGRSGVRGTGQNGDAHQVFNVQNAVNYIASRAMPYWNKSLKHCARRVREALNVGGLKAPWGAIADDAYKYIPILLNNGWYEIPNSQAGQPGDIVVVDRHPGHESGHIAMCTGNGRWASEYWHKTLHGLNDEPPAGLVHTFRYRNRAGMDTPPQPSAPKQ